MAINLKKDVFEEDIIKPEISNQNFNQNFNTENTVKQVVNIEKTENIETIAETEIQSGNGLKSSTNRVRIISKNTNPYTNQNNNLNKITVKMTHGHKPEKKKNIFSSEMSFDCDLSAILLGADETIIGVDGVDSCVYWGNPNYANNAIVLSDDKSGTGAYVEQLNIDTSKLPSVVETVVFAVNIDFGGVNKQSFGHTNALELQVVNENNKKELDFIDILKDFKSFNGLICGCVKKTQGRWNYMYLGKPISNVTTIADILKKFI